MSVRILVGDVFERLAELPDESVHCVVTSPPYWGLRDYGVSGQIGLEITLGEHLEKMVKVFAEVRRVMRPDATLWLNYGDGYSHGGNGSRDADKWPKQSRNDHRVEHCKTDSGFKPKDLLMIPNRLAIALQEDGWWVRSEIIWAKPNPMPESTKDRPTSSHEKIWLLTKSARYWYDAEAVRRPAASNEDANGFRGGSYVNGTAGPRTATGNKPRATDKQSGHSGRHAGFNDRWDQMTAEEQQDLGANLRNVWDIATKPFPEAHFATFPPALVEPCIKAGTSEKGVCAECGAPLTRDLKTTKGINRKDSGESDSKVDYGMYSGRAGESINETIGWSPSCNCHADTHLGQNSLVIPATVLDPFGGSGTTGLVADRLGRHAILIELNHEYAAMAERRIKGDAPMFTEVTAS